MGRHYQHSESSFLGQTAMETSSQTQPKVCLHQTTSSQMLNSQEKDQANEKYAGKRYQREILSNVVNQMLKMQKLAFNIKSIHV